MYHSRQLTCPMPSLPTLLPKAMAYMYIKFLYMYKYLCVHIFYEHVYICITFANSLMPSLPTLLAIVPVDVYLQVLYTANPTWGDIFES